MSKTAVIATGGKQYLVKKGDRLKIEKIKAEPGTEISFDKVLLVFDENSLELGRPNAKISVKGKVLEQGREKKISVIKFKSKVRYRRNVGYRHPFTRVEIVSVGE